MILTSDKSVLNEAIKLIGLNALALQIENKSGETMTRQNLKKYATGERTIQPWLLTAVRKAIVSRINELRYPLYELVQREVAAYREQISQPIVPTVADDPCITTFAEKLHTDTYTEIEGWTWLDSKKSWQTSMRWYAQQCSDMRGAPSVDFAQALIACGHCVGELCEIYRSEISDERGDNRDELISKIWDTIEANDLPRDSSTHEDEEELF